MPRAVRTTAADPKDRAFRVMSDATRREILRMLVGHEMRVKDLAMRFPVSRPAISKHLKVLREAGIVSMRRDGRDHWYTITSPQWQEAAGHVNDLEAFWQERSSRLDAAIRATGRRDR